MPGYKYITSVVPKCKYRCIHYLLSLFPVLRTNCKDKCLIFNIACWSVYTILSQERLRLSSFLSGFDNMSFNYLGVHVNIKIVHLEGMSG